MSLPAPLLLVAGLALLTGGAELLVRGASRLARVFGIPPLVVGLTVVAFGTSAPELAVSVRAALSGNADVSVGNVVGSNIFNVLFILGLSALIVPLTVQRQLVRLDIPVLVVVSALPIALGLDHRLGFGDGLLLLALGLGYTGAQAWIGLRGEDRRREAPRATHGPAASPSRGERGGRAPAPWLQLALVVGGLAALVVGADWMVDGALGIARGLGISDLVIGLTVVAAGTSLPEVATSVVASLRGERDIAVGNVVGSNIFNVLVVLGAAGVFGRGGVPLQPGVLALDLPVMLAVAAVCVPIFLTGRVVSRWEGAAFLSYYVLYVVYLGLHASDHPLEDEYLVSVLGFVLPLTLAVAGAAWMRSRRSDRPA